MFAVETASFGFYFICSLLTVYYLLCLKEKVDKLKTENQEKNKLSMGFALVASVQAKYISFVQSSVYSASFTRLPHYTSHGKLGNHTVVEISQPNC